MARNLTTAEAFAAIAALEYRKHWDMTGPCIVVREEWLENGAVVHAVEHNYIEDTAPPESEVMEITAADVGDLTIALGGVSAEGVAANIA